MTEIAFLEANRGLALIHARALSAREVTQASLRQIEMLDRDCACSTLR